MSKRWWRGKRGEKSKRLAAPTTYRAQPTVYCRTCTALRTPEKLLRFKPFWPQPCPAGGEGHEAWLYASTKEAKYARELDWKVKMGLVREWRWRQRFPLSINGQSLPDFIATFVVIENDGTERAVTCKPWGAKANGFWRYTILYQLHVTHQQVMRAIYDYEVETI